MGAPARPKWAAVAARERERARLKTGPGTLQLRVRDRRHAPVSAKPSVSGKPGWPALDSFTVGIIYGCHEAASECRAQKGIRGGQRGLQVRPKEELPLGGRGPGAGHGAQLRPLAADSRSAEHRSGSVQGGSVAACLLPGHFVVKALMRCQLSRVHLQPLHTAFLVWNVPCCSPNEVLPPPFHLDLSSVELPHPTPPHPSPAAIIAPPQAPRTPGGT